MNGRMMQSAMLVGAKIIFIKKKLLLYFGRLDWTSLILDDLSLKMVLTWNHLMLFFFLTKVALQQATLECIHVVYINVYLTVYVKLVPG